MKKGMCILIAILVITIITLLGRIVDKMDNDFMKGCLENGYSKQYCEAHK